MLRPLEDGLEEFLGEAEISEESKVGFLQLLQLLKSSKTSPQLIELLMNDSGEGGEDEAVRRRTLSW